MSQKTLDPSKYGLDHFGFELIATEHGLKVVTTPLESTKIADQIHALLGSNTEPDCVHIKGRMHFDGSTQITGVKPEAFEDINKILRSASTSLKQEIEALCSQERIDELAEIALQDALSKESMPTSVEDLKITCGCKGSRLVSFMWDVIGVETKIQVQGCPCDYPADFIADFNTFCANKVFETMVRLAPEFAKRYQERIEADQVRIEKLNRFGQTSTDD